MKKGIIIGVIVLLLVIVLSGSFYTVAENEYACTFRFSEIVNTTGEDQTAESARPSCIRR